MSASVLSFFRPAPATSGDWSQQELAEFYRVEAASLQAGLRLSLERGLSDEGDPWLVFCREDGEVFLHFARTDGSYVIVSDMLGEPLVGPNFRELLAELVARNPSVLPINRQTLGGSGGRSGAQILMHPAALLAAIVATTCLFSSMNEAVASELEGKPVSGERPSGETVSPYDVSATLRHQDHDIVEGDAARSRASEQRELAVSTSVVMACIASFLHQNSNQNDPTLMAKLMSAEALSFQTQASAEPERMAIATADAKSRDHGANGTQSIQAQDAKAEPSVSPESQTWLRLSPSEATAILLATPGASIVTIGLGGPQMLAQGGAVVGSAPLHFVELTSIGTVRLVAAHTSEASSTKAKSPANVSTAETGSNAGSGSTVSVETSAPATAANEVNHQTELNRPTSSADKVVVSSSITTAIHPVGGSVAPPPSPSTATGADLSLKLPLIAPDDNGSNHTASQVKNISNTENAGATVAAATLLPSNTANVKSGTSAFQDLSILSAKTVSFFLHSLIENTNKPGVTDGAKGLSAQLDIVSFTGQVRPSTTESGASKIGSGIAATDAASTSTLVPTAVIDLAAGTPLAIGKIPILDLGASDMTGPEKSLSVDLMEGHIESTGSQSPLTTVSAAPAASDGGAALTKISGPKLSTVPNDTNPVTGGSDTLVGKHNLASANREQFLLTNGTAKTSGTIDGSNTSKVASIPDPLTVQDATGTKFAASSPATEEEHTGALHSVTALVSSTNTTTKAVSISVTAGLVSLDAVQLRIIDTFIASTPNVEFKENGDTLEIYGPSAYNDPNLNIMTWDLGGGTYVKVIGISDMGHVA